MSTFQGKDYWALILGGSSGMGLASARKLAAEGMNLCLVHRDRRSVLPELEREWESLRGHGVSLITFNQDALRPEKRAEVINSLKEGMGEKGKLRLFMHSIAKGNLKAASPPGPPTKNLPEDLQVRDKELISRYEVLKEVQKRGEGEPLLGNDDFRLTLEAMAISLYDWVQDLFQAGLFADDARVLAMTSEGSRRAWRQYGAVAAAKAALESIVRTLALEYASFGIRANALQAGVTRTPSLDLIPNSDHLKLGAWLRNPMGRITRPEDVADVVYLLCRDEAAWINGAIIPVDGGESISG